MKYALIDNEGRATAFYSPDIHDTIPQGAVEITDEQWQEYLSDQGMKRFVNGQVVTRQKALAELKAEKLAAVQAKRLAKADGGMMIGQMKMPTDKEALVLLNAANAYLKRNPAKAIKRAGVGVIAAQNIDLIIDAVGDFQTAIFDREADLYDAIEASETIEALDAIDIESGW